MPDPSHLPALLRMIPIGPLSHEEDTVARSRLAAVGTGLDECETVRAAVLVEARPQGADVLLSTWERLYKIPSTGTTPDRLQRLLARVRLVPDFRPATIEARAEDYAGIDYTLLEPTGFRCDDADSLCDTSTDVVDGGLTFILDGAWADADAAGVPRVGLQALIDTIKPAHTVGFDRYDDFHTDDPYSLTDRDLLGA